MDSIAHCYIIIKVSNAPIYFKRFEIRTFRDTNYERSENNKYQRSATEHGPLKPNPLQKYQYIIDII